MDGKDSLSILPIKGLIMFSDYLDLCFLASGWHSQENAERYGSQALDSGGSANGELIRRDGIIKVRVRITICTKKYFDQEKPLIYLVSALTVAWVNKQRQDTECIPP